MKLIQSQGGLSIYEPGSDLTAIKPLLSDLSSGIVVLLKGVFSKEDAKGLRDAVFAWSQTLPTLDFKEDANAQNLNFHRVDGSPGKSSLPHVFHQYGFGNISALEEGLKSKLGAFAKPLLQLQNLLAGSDYRIEDKNFRVKLLLYIGGGGFLANHTHPLLPQRVGLICALSEKGADYTEGGTTFDTPLGKVDTGKYHDIGDVIAFRYDLAHEVLPTDPDETLDWNSDQGRWNLVLELLDTHLRSSTEL